MRDELLSYYERELTFLRQMGAEFAAQYPKVASRLQLEPNRCEDPHVERLLEAFALIAGRIQLKLEDEFPEITQALLNIVFPHFIRPMPSMSVAQFLVDPEQTRLTTALEIPKDSVLYLRPAGGVPCRFRTGYDTFVWPIRVVDAQWRTPDRLDPPVKSTEAVAALRLELACWPGTTFDSIGLDTIRFYLDGESNLVHALYELLVNNCSEILLRDPRPKFRQRPFAIPGSSIRPVGFEEDEGLLPYPRRSLSGYRLLQEYFAFPEKFFFLDLSGLKPLEWSGFKEQLEIVFLIRPFERTDRQELLEAGVSQRTFRLGCTPAVNCFPHTAEPIQVDQTRHEYPVIPDVRRPTAMEVFSIDEVVSTSQRTQETTPIEPLYAFRHSTGGAENRAFWHATRRTVAGRQDNITELWLTLVDLSGRPVQMDLDTLTVRCTCTNGDLPSRLPFGGESGDFELQGASAVHRIVALRKPTPALRPSVGRRALWRLISHLSLNYLSLVEEGREALQEILRLYQSGSQPFLEQQIDGIAGLRSDRRFARVASENGISYVRGVRVEMTLDEDKFVGGGVFLFSSVLERFFAQYVSMNSFSQLAVSTRQRKEVLREWAPRAGNRILL